MNLKKFDLLYNYIPSLKNVIENKKLTTNQKRFLNYVIKHYNSNPLKKNNKKILREELKTKRSKLSRLVLKKQSLLLNDIVLNSEEFKNSKSIFCYISFNNEIDTFEILNFCLRNKKILSVPVIKGKKIVPAKINNLDNLIENKYGILEPKKYRVMGKKNIDLVIVPALGYNPLGYRIGYGGGYYDDFLKYYKGLSIGMVMKKYLLTKFIPEKNDLPVNKIFIL